ncbi:15981_t:CDS:2, partial [Dentiscutata erythropus]
MSHLKGSNRTDNENHVIRSSRDSASSLKLEPSAHSTALEPLAPSILLEPKVPSTALEPLEPSILKTNSAKKNKRKQLLLTLFMIFVDVGIPLIISVVFNFILYKHVNTVGILCVTGFIGGVILSLIQDDPKLFLLRDSFISGNLKGLTEDEPIPDHWERYWRTYAVFRWTFIILTAIWGFGLLFEIPFRVLIIYKTRTTNDAVYIGAIF